MAIGKKAVFFTFIAIVFVSLLIFSTTVGQNYKLRQQSLVIETRINTMDRFISDVEVDLTRVINIVSVRTLFELATEVVSSGEYISDLDASFNELFLNGTLNGNVPANMANNSFTDWTQKIVAQGLRIDTIINFTIFNITIAHVNPWEVEVLVDLEIKLNDKKKTSSFKKRKYLSSDVSIENLEDPIFWLESAEKVRNIVHKTNVTSFVNSTSKNVSNLLLHTANGFYSEFDGAPSYLMRLSGNISGSIYGIESLLDLESLNLAQNGKSIVDYIYFNTSNPSSYHINNTPSWFRLDNSSNLGLSHHELYEVVDVLS